jgi:hypothetical protein
MRKKGFSSHRIIDKMRKAEDSLSLTTSQGNDPILYTLDEDHAKRRMPWIRDNVFEHPGEVWKGSLGR